MVGEYHIAHNKFCIYVDGAGKPRAVLTVSTNWTSTGVCTQSNNSVVVESDDLAAAYLILGNVSKRTTARKLNLCAGPTRARTQPQWTAR